MLYDSFVGISFSCVWLYLNTKKSPSFSQTLSFEGKTFLILKHNNLFRRSD
uniref:Uncharacterized protein n=1 Tax=Rhizophora mucronata TaxID=61149 RepID=A0A2P2QUH2_RHIMU